MRQIHGEAAMVLAQAVLRTLQPSRVPTHGAMTRPRAAATHRLKQPPMRVPGMARILGTWHRTRRHPQAIVLRQRTPQIRGIWVDRPLGPLQATPEPPMPPIHGEPAAGLQAETHSAAMPLVLPQAEELAAAMDSTLLTAQLSPAAAAAAAAMTAASVVQSHSPLERPRRRAAEQGQRQEQVPTGKVARMDLSALPCWMERRKSATKRASATGWMMEGSRAWARAS